MRPLRVGVLADTHVPGRSRAVPRAVHQLLRDQDVELILFAGDLTTLSTLKELQAHAPVEAVRGDVDFLGLPRERVVEVEGARVELAHGDGPGGSDGSGPAVAAARELGVDVLVLGHTHRLHEEEVRGLLILNPGSATGAWAGGGVRGPPSLMVLDARGRRLVVETYVVVDEGVTVSRREHRR